MKKNKKIRYLFSIISIFILILVFYYIFKPSRTPVERFKRLLSKKNISKPNIVFITLDTTRADHLGCYGYEKVQTPNMDRLAEEGILFEQCIAPSPLTLPSHSSMMTGLYPTYHGVRMNGNNALSDKHKTLAELFSENGYDSGAFIAAFVLDGRWGLKQGFQFYDDNFDLTKYKTLDLGRIQRRADEVINSAIKWIEQKKEKSFFAWIHLYDPHTPYTPPEPYYSEYKDRGIAGLYDGEISYMDEQIGRLITWLKDNKLKENTIIIIMGDHGEGLGSHGELTHGYFIYEYAIRVPFIIVTPIEEFKSIRIGSQVRIIDIYPTLLEMLNIKVPEENQGKSLLSTIFDPDKAEDLLAYSEAMSPNLQYNWSPLYSLRTNKFKYIEAPRSELYNLLKDPKELNSLIKKYPKIVKRLKNRLKEIIEKTSEGAPEPESANLDQETIRRLATLGYMGTAVSRKKTGKGNKILPDPKDKLDIFNAISKAYELNSHDKHKEAAKILEDIVVKDPINPQAKLLLASCYINLKEFKKAKEQLDIILKEDPENIKALVTQANIFMKKNKLDDVIAICNKTLSVDKQNVPALSLLSDIYMEKEELKKAHSYIKRAVDIQPKLTRNKLKLGICLVGMKNYSKAGKVLEDIADKYPEFPTIHFHLGLLYEEQRMFEKARHEYKREITNYENYVPARFNYAKLIFKENREEYIKHMRKIVKIAPELPKGYLFLARGLLFENVDINRILEMVRKGISLADEPDIKALGYFLLADIYTRKKQPKEVKEALEKARHFRSIREKKI